ncbi:MAG: PEP-CTERM sorting domain-containing protein [Pirellulales bacterium]
MLPVSSFAAAINYGDFMGTSVNYLMVQEDATTMGDAPPLFGKPTINEFPYPALPCTTAACTLPGNTLDFNPVGFAASAAGTGASGVDVTDGNLAFMVVAKPGQAIKNIKIVEQGDTTLTGIVPLNSMATATFAKMPVFIDIVQVDGVGITPINLSAISTPSIISTFSPSGGDFFLGVDGAGGPIFSTTWNGQLFVDLEAVLTMKGIQFERGVTKINVDLDNTLTALSEEGTEAVIAKKNFFTVTVNVPEPASIGLAALAMVLGLCLARRSRA